MISLDEQTFIMLQEINPFKDLNQCSSDPKLLILLLKGIELLLS